MLFKNLVFATLLASQTLSSPLRITIDVQTTEQPYEEINNMLYVQEFLGQLLIDDVSDLEKVGKLNQTLADMRTYFKQMDYQGKHLPDAQLGEGETSLVQASFEQTVGRMSEYCDAFAAANATIKELDHHEKFYRALSNDRNAWLQFFSALRPHLYRCTKEDDKACEGSRPFNRLNTEISAKMLKVQNIFRPEKSSEYELQIEL